MVSFLEELTRWNTSCWGIEPSAIVTRAAIQPSMSAKSRLGRNENLPSAAAFAMTLEKPPAMSLAVQATISRPTTITIICTNVVAATDHMPPNSV